jgi:hypothetical protein
MKNVDEHAAHVSRRAALAPQPVTLRDEKYYNDMAEARKRASPTTYNHRPTFGSAMNVPEQKWQHVAVEPCLQDPSLPPKPLLLPQISQLTPLPPSALRSAFKPQLYGPSFKLLPTLKPPVRRRLRGKQPVSAK